MDCPDITSLYYVSFGQGSHCSSVTDSLATNNCYMGGSKQWTFSETVDNRWTIVTLPSELSAVCIAQN